MFEEILYTTLIASIYVFAYLIMYPMVRKTVKSYDKELYGRALAIIMVMAAIIHTIQLTYFMISFIFIAMVLIISVSSGAEYVILSRVSRLYLAPLVINLVLISISLIMQEYNPIVYSIISLMYLIGVGAGAYKHLLPTLSDLYVRMGYSTSYVRATILNFIIICFLVILIRWFNMQLSTTLYIPELAPMMSDLGFLAGALIGGLYLIVSRGQRSYLHYK